MGARAGAATRPDEQPDRATRPPRIVHLGALRAPGRGRVSQKTLIVAADVTVLLVSFALAFLLWSAVTEPTAASERLHVRLAAASLPMWVLAMARTGLYRSRRITTPGDELRRLGHAVVFGTIASAMVPFLVGSLAARGWLISMALVTFPLLVLERQIVRGVVQRQRRRGVGLRPVVLVGGEEEGLDLRLRFTARPILGYDVVGTVDPDHTSVTDVLAAVAATGANGVVIATTEIAHELSNRLARELTDRGIHVELSSSLRGIDHRRLTVECIGEFPFVYVEPVHRTGWRVVAKRLFDMTLAGVVLTAAAPTLLLAALAIKLDSRGPVLFRQERVGRDGRPFRVLKLRTMVADAEARLGEVLALNEADGPLFKVREDPRITRTGRVLRKCSLDELPQLWNILRGEMSLVGPRPALPRELAGWTPQVHERLRVRPGLTGMWQVHGRAETDFEEYVRYDLYYVDNWSLATDAAILFRTVPAVLLGRGAS